MHVYPEVSGPISETWMAGKWLNEVPLDELTPMWADFASPANKHRHFYINEIAQTSQGSFVVPLRWLTVKGAVHVEVYKVTQTGSEQNPYFCVDTEHTARVSAHTLTRNLLDLMPSMSWDMIRLSGANILRSSRVFTK